MEQSNLDDHIKKMLEHLQADYQEDHWELMQQKLNDSANIDLAERPEDHILRQKLNQIKPEAQPEHWDLMAAQLAALNTEPLLEDALIDGIAYEHLKDLKVPYKEEHWTLMEEKIGLELHWKNKVVRYKVVELAMAFLFVFTFFQYWPDAKKIIPQLIKNERTPMARVLDKPSTNEEKATLETNSATAAVIDDNQEEDSQFDPTILNETTTETEVSFASNNSNDNTTRKTPSLATSIHDFSNPKKYDRVFDAVAPIASREATIDLLALDGEKKQTTTSTKSSVYLFSDFALLASHESGPLMNPEFHLPDCDDCNKPKSPRYLRIGMVANGTFDLINSNQAPTSSLNRETEDVDLSKIFKGSFGSAGGLTIGLKSKHWEFESGISYGSKHIIPKIVNVVIDRGELLGGFLGYGWVGSQVDLLQIPFNARYDFMKKPNWKVYGQGGSTLNLAINSIDRYLEYHVAPQNNPRTALRSAVGNNVQESIYFSNNEGISAGGSVKENSFLYLNVGLGIERQFSTRYSFFLQSNYHHFLGKGFKNTDLKIHSTSIQTGFKISLEKRSKASLKTSTQYGPQRTIQIKK